MPSLRAQLTVSKRHIYLILENQLVVLEKGVHIKFLGFCKGLWVTPMLCSHVVCKRICPCELMPFKQAPFNSAHEVVALTAMTSSHPMQAETGPTTELAHIP